MAYTNPNAKIRNFFDILTIERGDPVDNLAKVTTFSLHNYG